MNRLLILLIVLTFFTCRVPKDYEIAYDKIVKTETRTRVYVRKVTEQVQYIVVDGDTIEARVIPILEEHEVKKQK